MYEALRTRIIQEQKDTSTLKEEKIKKVMRKAFSPKILHIAQILP